MIRIFLAGIFLLLMVRLSAQQEITVESIDFWTPVADTFVYFNYQDTSLSKYRLPQSFKKPSTWIEAEKKYNFYNSNDTVGYLLRKVFDILDSDSVFWNLCAAKTWCFVHPTEAFPGLIASLTNKTKIGLVNTADLIIWDRIRTGELKFYGHGGGMQEDIFTVAGRASWILNWMTGEEFAIVGITMTPDMARKYQEDWVKYIEKNSR